MQYFFGEFASFRTVFDGIVKRQMGEHGAYFSLCSRQNLELFFSRHEIRMRKTHISFILLSSNRSILILEKSDEPVFKLKI